MNADARYLVVGAGQAGGRAAEALRAAGFAGELVLIGAEHHRPYERPPLSKAVLVGTAEASSAYLRGPDYYEAHGIALRTGTRVEAIDRDAGRVRLSDGATLGYDKLLLATGSVVRRLRLPGAELAGVHYLRSIDDCLAIREGLRRGARVAIVGGGYIGLEVAAAARARGCEVAVLEACEEVMPRVVAPEVGRYFRRLHRRRGVDVRTGAAVEGFEGGQRVSAVRLAGGEHVACDLAVVGVGIRPDTALAEAAGLEVDDGVVVDEYGRTSDPRIHAAGDVTNHPNPILGRRLRLESWQNAQNQAVAVAHAMCGEDTAYAEVPWFWSDQYDMNLQMVGMPQAWDRLVFRGEPPDGRFTVFYVKDGALVGANAVNNARDIPPARRLLAQARRLDPQALADPRVSLKKLLKG